MIIYPAVGITLHSVRPAVTFPAKEHHLLAAEIVSELFQRHWTRWKIFVSCSKLLK